MKYQPTTRRILLILVALIFFTGNISVAQAVQTLTIEDCYNMARANYPLVKRLDLIEKTKGYSLDNASKGNLPQISLNGQATYQSAVTALPVALPNINIPTVSKDQYKVFNEITQPLTANVAIKQQKKLINVSSEADAQQIEVALYQLKERVNNIFFGILLIDAQIAQVKIMQSDIESGIERTNAAIANGTALKSSVNVLKAELLKAKQKSIELRAAANGFREMLGVFINQKIDEQTTLIRPIPQVATNTINRPELRLYDIQQQQFDVQKKLIDAKNIPKLGLFLQSGYGRPALNMLNNEFDFYYLGGLRLNWSLSGFYTARKEKKILSLGQQSVSVQKETFLLNTKMAMTQQNSEVNKYKELMSSDNEIIMLREEIKNTSKNQLENGTITVTDYLVNVNAEDQARHNLILHQIQLLMAQYNYQITSGN